MQGEVGGKDDRDDRENREDREDRGDRTNGTDGIDGKSPIERSAPINPIKRSGPIYPIKRVRKGLKVSERVIFSTLRTLITRNKFVVRRG